MPDPQDHARRDGDTRPPEVEDGARQRPRGQPGAEGARGEAEARSLGTELQDEGRPGKGINQAGYLKDDDGDLEGGK